MPPTYAIASYLYLRTLGWCALAAFAAMYAQCLGLIGSHGLTPVATTMAQMTALAGGANWLQAPTVFWWSTADWMVQGVFVTGMVAATLLLLGIVPRYAALLAWLVVLTVRTPEGLGLRWFNWPFDDLLAESLFVGIWLAPHEAWSSPVRPTPPTRWARWLLLWLLFRLILGTGVTKLLVGGAWFDLVAVQQFLVTQPFPMALAATMHDGPQWLLQGACLYTMAYELLAPWCFWWPGRPARFAGLAGIPLMVGIFAIGSFRGFNHLTVAMLLVLVDDATWQRWLPARLRPRLQVGAAPATGRLRRAGGAAIVGLVVAASFEPIALQAGQRHDALPLAGLREALRPFHLAANYWVFCQVSAERVGLVVQGSEDGEHWRDYQPHGLPAAVDHWPTRVAPGNDHLGFLMWLSSYGGPEIAAAWLPGLLQGLLRGDAPIRALFAHDPFPAGPPRHVRAIRCLFTFASADERATGVFWRRQQIDVHATASR